MSEKFGACTNRTSLTLSVNNGVIVMSWYSPADWKRLTAIPEAHIRKSYYQFVRAAERAERMLAARCIRVRRLPIDIDHMITWCRRNNYKIDEAGRAIYGNAMAGALLDVLIEDKIARSIQ
jgi:hypothetical protein